MALMRTQNRQASRHRDGMRVGLKVSGSVENGGLLEYFFGKDGKTCLKHGKFVQFLSDLHGEVCILISLSCSLLYVNFGMQRILLDLELCSFYAKYYFGSSSQELFPFVVEFLDKL